MQPLPTGQRSPGSKRSLAINYNSRGVRTGDMRPDGWLRQCLGGAISSGMSHLKDHKLSEQFGSTQALQDIGRALSKVSEYGTVEGRALCEDSGAPEVMERNRA
jgi:hypothetical protein